MTAQLPTLKELGPDLLQVSRTQIALSLLRPLLCFVLYWPFAIAHLYLPATLCVVGLMFFTYTSTTHDFVHKTLHLPERLNEVLLSLLEAIALRSGHSFRLTHLQHHRHFPDADDVEGSEGSHGFWRALAAGPTSQLHLFAWAWAHADTRDRRWMFAEAGFIILTLVAAALTWHTFPALALYCALVIVGSWFYPLATVWWPHCAAGTTQLEQTRGFRGHIVPFLFFQHTFHLEHHLYPAVSSHQWRELGRRLEPHLLRAGVKFVHLP